MSRRRPPCSAALVRVRDKARVADRQSREDFKDYQRAILAQQGRFKWNGDCVGLATSTIARYRLATPRRGARPTSFSGAGGSSTRAPWGMKVRYSWWRRAGCLDNLSAARGLTILRD